MTTFSKLLASVRQEVGTPAAPRRLFRSPSVAGAPRPLPSFQLEVPADWMQGRSVFGGLQVAFALRAMRALVPNTPLRTLQTTFVAPVSGSMRAQARILRQGKNVTHVEARLGDDGATQAVVIGAFGSARESAVSRRVVRPTLEVDPARTIAVPFLSRSAVAPHFAGHFSVSWLRGLPPFTGDTTYDHVLEVGIDDEGPASEAHLIAIADYPPPVALSHLKAAAPGSTLTWMLQLLVDDFASLPLAGFRIDTDLVAARDGYTSQAVTIYAPDGTALALSHQNMLVFG